MDGRDYQRTREKIKEERKKFLMKTDIQIAQEAKMLPIKEVAKQLKIEEDELELYGKYKAKLSEELEEKIQMEN